MKHDLSHKRFIKNEGGHRMKPNRLTQSIIWLILLIIVIAGCSKEKVSEPNANQNPETTQDNGASTTPNNPAPAVQEDPVTLKIMYVNTLVAKEDIEQFIAQPVKEKYPYITIEHMEPVSLPNLLATGGAAEIPDLVITDYPNLSTVIDLQYPADMTESIKSNNVNLEQVEVSTLNGIKKLSDTGTLYGLPIYLDKYMMFYNKEIFDKFAVSYPSDDMSFEELVSLARTMTRKDGDVQYLGYRWVNLYTFGYQLANPVLNPNTGKADLQTDSWKYILSLVKDLIDSGNDTTVTTDHFFKEERLAIYPQFLGAAYGLLRAAPQLDWDMAALPYSEKYPDITGPTKPIYLIASTTSKHKEHAMKAIAYVATSPEVQALLSQQGRISTLSDASIQQQFGSGMELLAGKNVAAIFKYPFGELPFTTAYESKAWPGLNTAPANVMQGTDINSALRLAEEEANKAIDEYLSQK